MAKPRSHNQKILSASKNRQATLPSVDKDSLLWQLIESSNDGLGILDHHFRLIMCNQSFAHSLGYTPQEMIGKYAWDWDARYDSQEDLFADLSDGSSLPGTFETLHRRKDGSLTEVEITLSTKIIEDNGIYMFVCKDITEQRKEKRSLLQTRFAMDNAKDNCTWFDADGKIIYVNHSACRTLGYSKKQLLSKTIFDIAPKYSKSSFAHLVEKLKKHGALLFESEHLSSNGKLFPVEISANYFKEGPNSYICVFDRDITTRKIAEKALQEQSTTLEENVAKRTHELLDEIKRRRKSEKALQKTEAKFKALAENARDVIIRFDRQYRLLYVNPAVKTVTSYSPEELIGKSFSELKRSKSIAPYLNSALEKVFTTGKLHQIEFMLPHGIWIESLLSPEIDNNGEITAVVSTSRDITIHKETLAKLNMYNQLQLLLTDIALTFINLPLHETNSAINKALGEIATFVRADHAFIIHYDYNTGTYSDRYSFRKKNCDANTPLPYSEFIDYINRKKGQKIIHIPNSSQLPEDHTFKQLMSQSGMNSLIIVPMLNGKEITGCFGFETYQEFHNYSEQEQQLLVIFAQLLVNIDKRNETETALKEQHSFQEIIASIAVRFVAVNEYNLNELIANTLRQLDKFFNFDRSSFFFHDGSISGELDLIDVVEHTLIDHSPNLEDIHPVIRDNLHNRESIFKTQTIFHFPVTDKIHSKNEVWRGYFAENGIKSALYLSCKTDQNVYGILGFEMKKKHTQWSQTQMNGLVIVAQILGYTLANLEARKALLASKETLETRVQHRTKELIEQIKAREKAMHDLAKAQSSLLEASRSAGMAEVATNVLHNVGNVLNSINVSCNLLISTLNHSRLVNFSKITGMLQATNDNYGHFLTQDSKGKHIPDYLISLAPQLEKEQQIMFDEVQLLSSKIDHIKQIVSMQQGYGRVHDIYEQVLPKDLFEDALSLSTSLLNKYTIRVEKKYEDLPVITSDKHKVMQVLLNLITNACNAFEKYDAGRENIITLALLRTSDNTVQFIVKDNGIGIIEENISKIFQYGFTTRKLGHGFGLHSGALAASQLGGTLTASSKGIDLGATFTLELPVHNIEKAT